MGVCVYKAISKISNERNETIGYMLIDTFGNTMRVDSKRIKESILRGTVQCVNLKVTSDNKLIMYKPKPIHAIMIGTTICPRSKYDARRKYDEPVVKLWFNLKKKDLKIFEKEFETRHETCFVTEVSYEIIVNKIKEGVLILDNAELSLLHNEMIQSRLKLLRKNGASSAEIKQYEKVYYLGDLDLKKKVKFERMTDRHNIDENLVWNVLNNVHKKVQTVIKKPVPVKKCKGFLTFEEENKIHKYYKDYEKYCELFIGTFLAYTWYKMTGAELLMISSKLSDMMYDTYGSDNPRFSIYTRWLPCTDDTFLDCVMFIIIYYGKEVFDMFRSTTRKDDLRKLGVDFGNITDYGESFRYMIDEYIDFND